MSDNLRIAIIGAGLIARKYVKVVLSLGHDPIVIGRGQKNIDELKLQFPAVDTNTGGLEDWLGANQPPAHAIIATPIQYLATATKQLLKAGTRYILVEKPLTYSVEEAQSLADLARSLSAEVTVAFNRRSYVSVKEAARLIQQDGGVSSFHFDFTEATFRIDPGNYDISTNQYWGIANSSHVIDTAFFLGGKPKWMECRQYGEAISWHDAGSIFTGIGETENGVPFTYHANWGCPGKWNIEIMTPERKLLFSPMERLHQQVKGSFRVELVELDYSVDTDYKPGFFQQVEAWLEESPDYLIYLTGLASEIVHYKHIFSYE
jgi:predicted dehydrogenase